MFWEQGGSIFTAPTSLPSRKTHLRSLAKKEADTNPAIVQGRDNKEEENVAEDPTLSDAKKCKGTAVTRASKNKSINQTSSAVLTDPPTDTLQFEKSPPIIKPGLLKTLSKHIRAVAKYSARKIRNGLCVHSIHCSRTEEEVQLFNPVRKPASCWAKSTGPTTLTPGQLPAKVQSPLDWRHWTAKTSEHWRTTPRSR